MRFRVGMLLAAILLTAGRAEAGPKHWIKTHKRFLVMEGLAFTGAAIHYKGLNDCRKRNGPEPCDLHYGSAWAAFWVVTGMNVVAMPAIAESCWKEGQGHFCDIFAYGGSAAQAGWGIHEWRIGKPHVETDLRVLTRHR